MGNWNGMFSKCTNGDEVTKADQQSVKAAVEQNKRMVTIILWSGIHAKLYRKLMEKSIRMGKAACL